ncbi:hypothetical protein D3C85_1390100 [compost metagenome]
MDRRRVTALRFREHPVIGGQRHTPHAHAVEQCAVGEAVAEHDLAIDGSQRTLRIGLHALVLRAVVVVVQAAVVAEPPGADIEASVQSNIGLVEGGAELLAAIGIGVVLEGGCRDTVVPVLGIHIAARRPEHRHLGHAHVQAQIGLVEGGTRPFDKIRHQRASVGVL